MHRLAPFRVAGPSRARYRSRLRRGTSWRPTEPRFHGLLALLLVAYSSTALGQSARVSIDLDKHIASVGEEVQVTVQIEIEGNTSYSQYIPPAFTDLRVTGGGMTTQNIQMINWQVRRTEGYSYVVAPLKEGTLTVGPAAIVMGGRTIRSATVSLRVKAGAPPGAPAPPPSSPPGPDQVPYQPPSDRSLSSVFLSAVAVPQKVYQGQQLAATWLLYTQSDVLGFNTTRQPATDSFWTEDLRSPQRLELERRMVGDRVYYAAVLSRKALFPLKSGRLTIGPMEAQVRTMDTFAAAPLTRQSEELTIEVLPLPDRGRPDAFPGANVGQYDIWATLDRPSVKAGEAVTLRVVVRGTGNLTQLKLPALPVLDGFRGYDPKVSDKLELEGKVAGEKIAEYLLIPTRAGRLTVPGLHLDYFDPQSGRYRRATTEPIGLTVTGEMPAALPGRTDARSNVLGPNIRPPRPSASFAHQSTAKLHRTVLFWALFAFPVTLLLLMTGGERLRARLARETPGSLRRAATRRVRGHLRRADETRRHMHATVSGSPTTGSPTRPSHQTAGGRGRDRGSPGEFFAEIAAAIHTQLGHQMALHTEGMTRDELRARLGAAGFPADLVEEVLGELDNCDFARFAAAASGDQQMGEALTRTRQLVARLSRVSLRGGPA
jgi:hypothetical protein